MYQLRPLDLVRHLSATTSLLLFGLEDLSIVDTGVVRSPTTSVLLSTSFLKSSEIFLVYLCAPILWSNVRKLAVI